MSKQNARLASLLLLTTLIVVAIIVAGYLQPPATTSGGNINTYAPASQTKTSGCIVNGALQDKSCTPGLAITTATKDQICTPGYASSVRNVPVSEKRAVYEEYGIMHHTPGSYEIDHLISLELGGSNDIANLWPEAADPTPGFHQKDKVEDYLHQQVCDGHRGSA